MTGTKIAKAEASDRKRCFVIGPIGAEESEARRKADWLFEGIVKPVFAAHFADYEVTRSDKINKPGMIDVDMINLLYEAELVIADMTGLNANAFYEMGIRHAVGLPIIHMFEVGTDIPFDVKPHRAIPYSLARYLDLEAAKNQLKANIDEAIRPDFTPDNPVSRARGIQHIKEHATPADQLLLDEVLNIKSRLQRVENRIEQPPRFPSALRAYEVSKKGGPFAIGAIKLTKRVVVEIYASENTEEVRHFEQLLEEAANSQLDMPNIYPGKTVFTYEVQSPTPISTQQYESFVDMLEEHPLFKGAVPGV